MKKASWKLTVCAGLLCLTVAFIWGNSLMPAELSSEFSETVMSFLKDWVEIPSSEGGSGIHRLRKLAHFTEFLLLGLEFAWLFLLLKERGIHRMTMPLLCGSLVACADETIQLYSAGRSSSMLDVWIDIGGLTVGIAVLLLGYAILTKGRTREQNNFGG